MSSQASPGATTRPVTSAERADLQPVLQAFGLAADAASARYIDLRCEKTYDVYRVSVAGRLSEPAVLKQDAGEYRAYDRWLSGPAGLPVAQRLASHELAGVRWHLLEHVGDRDLQSLTVQLAEAAGHAVAELHSAFWQDSAQMSRELRERLDKRRTIHLDVVEAEAPDVADALAELDHRSRLAPRTLCNGDLLPMNLIWDGSRVRMIDFAEAAIRPYFSDLARFLVFGGPGPKAFYPQPEGCREAFLAAYLRVVRERTGTGLSDGEFSRDVLLGELYEHVSVVSWTLRRERAGKPIERDENFTESLAAARKLAQGVRASELSAGE